MKNVKASKSLIIIFLRKTLSTYNFAKICQERRLVSNIKIYTAHVLSFHNLFIHTLKIQQLNTSKLLQKAILSQTVNYMNSKQITKLFEKKYFQNIKLMKDLPLKRRRRCKSVWKYLFKSGKRDRKWTIFGN